MKMINLIKLNMRLLIATTILSISMTVSAQIYSKNPEGLVPLGYNIFEKLYGDLNQDGLSDVVLIIKATDNSKIVKDPYKGKLDKNRRGLIIAFNRGGQYESVLVNANCFSSENEDGGVYFAPQLFLNIERGNLYINYGHGRYGGWKYTFRYYNNNFALIGYDAVEGGAVTNSSTSINFLTKKKLERVNTNPNAQGGDEVFKDSWSDIKVNSLKLLKDIKDFDTFNFGN
jgi:hypothetical protein